MRERQAISRILKIISNKEEKREKEIKLDHT